VGGPFHSRHGPDQKRIVNWIGDRALSGDILVEQNVHVIDMATGSWKSPAQS